MLFLFRNMHSGQAGGEGLEGHLSRGRIATFSWDMDTRDNGTMKRLST